MVFWGSSTHYYAVLWRKVVLTQESATSYHQQQKNNPSGQIKSSSFNICSNSISWSSDQMMRKFVWLTAVLILLLSQLIIMRYNGLKRKNNFPSQCQSRQVETHITFLYSILHQVKMIQYTYYTCHILSFKKGNERQIIMCGWWWCVCGKGCNHRITS